MAYYIFVIYHMDYPRYSFISLPTINPTDTVTQQPYPPNSHRPQFSPRPQVSPALPTHGIKKWDVIYIYSSYESYLDFYDPSSCHDVFHSLSHSMQTGIWLAPYNSMYSAITLESHLWIHMHLHSSPHMHPHLLSTPILTEQSPIYCTHIRIRKLLLFSKICIA